VKLNHLKIMTFVSGLLLPLSVFADDHTVFPELIIKSHLAPKSDIGSLSNYCFYPMDDIESQHIITIHPDLEKWLKTDIASTMQEKNYTEVPNYQCELQIGYAIHIREQAMLHAPRINHSKVLAERIELIPERTLIIHAHDLHRNKTLWIGSAEEVIFDDDRALQSPEKIQSRFKKSVYKMFKRFPNRER